MLPCFRFRTSCFWKFSIDCFDGSYSRVHCILYRHLAHQVFLPRNSVFLGVARTGLPASGWATSGLCPVLSRVCKSKLHTTAYLKFFVVVVFVGGYYKYFVDFECQIENLCNYLLIIYATNFLMY